MTLWVAPIRPPKKKPTVAGVLLFVCSVASIPAGDPQHDTRHCEPREGGGGILLFALHILGHNVVRDKIVIWPLLHFLLHAAFAFQKPQ